MNTAVICQQLQSLAQETRLKVFRKLVSRGDKGMCAGDICKELDIPCSRMSFHLNQLSNAGLIFSERRGRYIIYFCNFTAAKNLSDYLTKNCCAPDECDKR